MATHIVIGNGPCSSEAVTASLKDVIAEGDALALAWVGVNIPESVEAVYKFAFDTEMELTVFYSEGQTVHSMVRDRDHVSVIKVRDTRESLLKTLRSSGVDSIEVFAGEPYDKEFIKFFRMRERRLRT